MKQFTLKKPPISLPFSPFMIPKIQVKIKRSAADNHRPPPRFAHSCRIIHNRQIHQSLPEETTATETCGNRKPRILCLHGFRTSGEILKIQLRKWPESVIEKVELFFPDAPFPSHGKSDVEGMFDPPYYEWFQFNKDTLEYENFDKCVDYVEECMIKHGPIDGFLGFSQGAILSAALPGLQAKGMALRKVPKIKFLMIVAGAKLRNRSLAENAYLPPFRSPSLHFLGERDFLKPYGIELLKSFVEPVVVHHPSGHTIPRLDEKNLDMIVKFLDRIQKIVSSKEDVAQCNPHKI